MTVHKTKEALSKKYATFFINDAQFGIELTKVQEINKNSELTMVPQSPEKVMGVMNLRGRIVTIIDTGKNLGLTAIQRTKNTRNIIVQDGDEHIGLAVDCIGNVLTIEVNRVFPPPANIVGVKGKYFDGVFKTEGGLVGLLNLESVFN